MTRPGARLRSIATWLFDPSTMERLIDPAIADLQHEHDDAMRRGLVWRGRWVHTAGCIAVWKVMAASATTTSTRTIGDWACADGCAVGRTIGHSCATISAVVALLIWAPLSSHSDGIPANHVAWMVIYLVPQALLVAIPLGLMVGILSGLRGRVVTIRVRRSVVAMVILSSLATFVLAAWTMPTANQAFRELIAGHRLPRGFNEMTLVELARTRAPSISAVSATANRLAFELHFRLALAFASLALGLFAIAVTAAWRGAYRVRGVVIVGSLTGIAYYVLLFWARQAGYSADERANVAAAWIPNLVFFAMTLLLFHRPFAAETQESHQ
jgi:hypothetical protein